MHAFEYVIAYLAGILGITYILWWGYKCMTFVGSIPDQTDIPMQVTAQIAVGTVIGFGTVISNFWAPLSTNPLLLALRILFTSLVLLSIALTAAKAPGKPPTPPAKQPGGAYKLIVVVATLIYVTRLLRRLVRPR